MRTWIALLRGVNIGGHHQLPMKTLTADLEKLGCTKVRTYIQSGNAVFQAPDSRASTLARRIETAILDTHGFRPHVLLLRRDQLEHAVDSNPFPEAEAKGSTLALLFLEKPPPHPDKKGLDAAKQESERWMLKGAVFYLHAPRGFGRSRLAANVEKLLGVEATGRNWNSVLKILQMAKDLE